MMKHKVLLSEIHDRLNKLADYAKAVSKDHDEEDIHKLRVNYKKLRALLRMSSGHMRRSPIPQALMDLYAAAGTIRDLQLHVKTVSGFFQQYDTLPEIYLQYIQQQANEAGEKFDKRYKHFSFSRTRKLVQHRLPHDLPDESIKQWRARHKNSITCLTQGELNDEQVHEIRKLMKDLDYTASYAANSVNYKELTGLIGSYIDKSVLLHLINTHISGAAPGEIEMLGYAVHRWNAEKEELRQNVVNRLVQAD